MIVHFLDTSDALNSVADFRIPVGGCRRVTGEACQSVDEIAAVDDADHSRTTARRLIPTTLQHLDDVFQRIVLRSGVRIGCHDIIDFSAGGMHVFAGEPRMGMCDAGFDSDQSKSALGTRHSIVELAGSLA